MVRDFDTEALQKIFELTIWTKQPTFDPYIQVSAKWLEPDKPFRIGCLEKMFSKDVFLHRKYRMAKMHTIFEVPENINAYISRTDSTSDHINLEDKTVDKANLVVKDEGGEEYMTPELEKKLNMYGKEVKGAKKFDSKIPFTKITSKDIQKYKVRSLIPSEWIKIQKERVDNMKKNRLGKIKDKYKDVDDFIDKV